MRGREPRQSMINPRCINFVYALYTFCECKTNCVATEDEGHGKEKEKTPAEEGDGESISVVDSNSLMR
ncbi:hypothetical protein EVAR_25437_1 [Eumeta japonica]|uniref:Uncharacterized protein n=1 Tax=Eumeta variegata TaxID=151549 RepID=A0A4C1V7W8_EUMVA|nr:hypothetical protein EVAR_25437_1 [Eumeta japonica]